MSLDPRWVGSAWTGQLRHHGCRGGLELFRGIDPRKRRCRLRYAEKAAQRRPAVGDGEIQRTVRRDAAQNFLVVPLEHGDAMPRPTSLAQRGALVAFRLELGAWFPFRPAAGIGEVAAQRVKQGRI